ncbi:hypothetical protein EVAR_28647_1 [Eumeta japonica]|uniref:Solute carrier family 46 member 3 n=1 Tax=Eumeta variegata TaxID=151549 RepID=A0A4C1ZML7_EUMVA|nr:hypothetical protein EVAR_28647_1 [Eumeta japonica]
MTSPEIDVNDKSDNEEFEKKPLNEDTSNAVKFKDKTFKEKVNHVLSNVTVEPLLACVIIPSVISRFAMGNLNLDKACRVHMQYADVVCDALIKRTTNNFTAQEKEIQRLISSIDIWKGILQTLLPSIIIMFLGAWSDRTGRRKLCILMPIFGEILTSINNLINVYFFYEIPVHLTVFLETLFTAATGGWVTMFLGIFSYISDITTEKTRTFRVGLANFCMTVGLPIGIALGVSFSLSVIKPSGALFSITVFSRRLQFHDSLLCLISCGSKFVGSVWTAFVTTDLEMFLVPVVEILNGVTFTSLRSLMTKLVDKDEIARANSLFSLVETLASLLFQPMYSWIYMITLHVFPGTVYIFSATMIIPAIVILTTFFVQHRIQIWKEKKKKILDTEIVLPNCDTEFIAKDVLNETVKT